MATIKGAESEDGRDRGKMDIQLSESNWRSTSWTAIHRRLPAWMTPLFIFTVCIPTIVAATYYTFIASDIYVSESRYIVRTQGKQIPSGLASLIVGQDGGGFGGNAMTAVAEYATSRDAMKALNEKGRLTQIFSRPEIDLFSDITPLGGKITNEDLFQHFTKHVALGQETQSSISTLVVKAYTPEDARWINERLLELGEGLVNRLNERSRVDLVRYAQQEVDEAKKASRDAAFALADYRNRFEVIDPEKQASVSLQMVSKLQDELILTKTQLTQMRAFTPGNPQVPVLRERISSLNREIEAEMLKVAGGKGSLAAKSAEYSRLVVEAEYAEKLLTNALVSLQNASNEARRQQAYVERIVQPNVPDKATQPRRFRGILSVFVLGLAAWGVLSLLFSAMREHKL